jgi:hypothetical protein
MVKIPRRTGLPLVLGGVLTLCVALLVQLFAAGTQPAPAPLEFVPSGHTRDALVAIESEQPTTLQHAGDAAPSRMAAALDTARSTLSVALTSNSGQRLTFGRLLLIRAESVILECEFDEQGLVDVKGLDAGCYGLAIAADSIPAGWLDDRGASTSRSSGASLPILRGGVRVLQLVEMDGIASKSVEIVLQTGATLAGRIFDSEGNGIQAPQLISLFFAPGDAGGRVETTTTLEGGYFELRGLPASHVRIGAVRSHSTGEVSLPVDVQLFAGETSHTELHLSSQSAHLRGRVQNAYGEALSGVRVRARLQGLSVGSARTNEQGEFDMGGLPCVPLQVEVHPCERVAHPGRSRGRQRRVKRTFGAIEATPNKVENHDVGVLVVEEPETFMIHGRVIGLSAAELIGARASAHWKGDRRNQTSRTPVNLPIDKDGRFTFVCETPAQDVDIRVTATDERRAESREHPTAGTTLERTYAPQKK